MLHDPVFDESLIPELQPGERLLWSGRPDTSRWLVPDDPWLGLVLAGGLFDLGLSAIILSSNLRADVSGFDLVAVLLGLLFAGFGLYLVIGRFIVRRYFGRRTAYGLTNLRALVIKPTWRGGRQTAFVWLTSGPGVNERISRDGHGTLMIGATIYQQGAPLAADPGWFLFRPAWSYPSDQPPLVAFWNIADAAEVSGLAAQLISEASAVSEPA